MGASDAIVVKQHLIDPEICIRCNTCESICPIKAISHDDNNYVVDVNICKQCMACIAPCPTGSIDNWRFVPKAKAYSVQEQLGWDELPAELSAQQLTDAGAGTDASLPRTSICGLRLGGEKAPARCSHRSGRWCGGARSAGRKAIPRSMRVTLRTA